MKDFPLPQASISEQAAEWLLELAHPDNPCNAGSSGLGEERHRQFMRWLTRSPQHIEEFLAIAMLEQELGEQRVPLADIVAELKAAGAATPEPLFPAAPATPATAGATTRASAPAAAGFRDEPEQTREPGRRRRQQRGRARRVLAWAAAAGVAALAVVLVQFAGLDAAAVRHATVLGEQRAVALDDGSVVTLNTLSEVDIDIGRSQRHVDLLAGEAMFDVAPDAARPFIVEAGNVSLTVLGTKFSVYRMGDVTRLAVVEGAVQVVPNGKLATVATPVVVRAGEGLIAGRNGVTPIGAGAEFEMAIAWTDGRLVFDGAPLAAVVNEFNRYNEVAIVVEDSELARREVTTVFKANDVDALVSFLELEPGIDVRRDGDAIRIRQTTDDTEGRHGSTARE